MDTSWSPASGGLAVAALVAAAAVIAWLLRALREERLSGARCVREAREEARRLGDAERRFNAASLHVAALGRREDGRRIQLLQGLMDVLPVGVSIVRAENGPGKPLLRVAEVNPAGLQLLGMAGKSAADIPAIEEASLRDLLLESMRTGQARDLYDYPSRVAPGTRFALKIFPLGPDSAGIVFEDVTAQGAAHDALRRSEEQLRLMIDVVQDYAIFRLDADGRIATWNRGAQAITGYRVDQIVGRPLDVLFEPEAVRAGEPGELLRRAARDGRAAVEGWRLRRDGSRFWSHAILTALKGDDGRLRGFVKMVHDETRRRREACSLERARAELQRSNAELTQFATVASHDLQSPLRKTAAFADQVEERLRGKLEPEDRELLTRMRAGLTQMQEQIDALLGLARAGAAPATPITVDVETLARAVRDELEPSLRDAVDLGALPAVRADPTQLRRLLQNLISNAVKFRRPEAAASVRVRGRTLPDGTVELRVEDDGVGFDMKDSGRLFQPFSRLHARRDFPGSGMGLAICRRIVENHGGTISIVSAPGRGTVATVTLPGARTAERTHGGASWTGE